MPITVFVILFHHSLCVIVASSWRQWPLIVTWLMTRWRPQTQRLCCLRPSASLASPLFIVPFSHKVTTPARGSSKRHASRGVASSKMCHSSLRLVPQPSTQDHNSQPQSAPVPTLLTLEFYRCVRTVPTFTSILNLYCCCC